MENGRLVRYTPPTRFDVGEYGQIWEKLNDDNSHELWIQTNTEESNPLWVRVGYVLEKVFSAQMYDEKFLKECLEKYK